MIKSRNLPRVSESKFSLNALLDVPLAHIVMQYVKDVRVVLKCRSAVKLLGGKARNQLETLEIIILVFCVPGKSLLLV